MGDLTAAFGLKKEKTQFSITFGEDFDLQKALQSLYGENTVSIPDDAETNNPYPVQTYGIVL